MLDLYETRRSKARRLAVGFSRSGHYSELLLANDKLCAAGFSLLGINCSEGSAQLKQADHPVLVSEGHEDGLVMLRSLNRR